MECFSSFDAADVISSQDFMDLMPSFWHEMKPGCPNLNHIHAVHLKGPRLDSQKLRAALDGVQARHIRLRAKLHMKMGKAYLLKDNTPIPLYELDGADHNCMNLDFERVLQTNPDPHPAVWATYIFYNNEHSVLLLGFRHGAGDGRAIEVALAHLLRLYDGQEVPMCKSHMNYTEIIGFDGTFSPEIIENWKIIEEEFPPVPENAINDTFVQPHHPEFRPVFALSFCASMLRRPKRSRKQAATLARPSLAPSWLPCNTPC